MKRNLTLLVLAGALPASAYAMESATVGSEATQATVNVLNTKIDSLMAALQAMVNGMSTCNAQRKFYAPSDPRKDASGCVAPGAYELSDTGTNNGDAGQFRMPSGTYGTFWRNDGANTYLLATNTGDSYGGWNGLRPFYVNDASGMVNMNNGLTVTNPGTAVTANGTSGYGIYGTSTNNWSGVFNGVGGLRG